MGRIVRRRYRWGLKRRVLNAITRHGLLNTGAVEGRYAAGYRDALGDVLKALDGATTGINWRALWLQPKK